MKYIKHGLAVLMSISTVLLVSCGSSDPVSQENIDIIVAVGSTVRTESQTAPTETEAETAEQTSATATEASTASETTSEKPMETTTETTTETTVETTSVSTTIQTTEATTVTTTKVTTASTTESASINADTVVTGDYNGIAYVLNTNTKRIHYSGCSSVSSIKPHNYAETADFDGAIKAGYKPCGRCKPQ